jgi:hypothetical protein
MCLKGALTAPTRDMALPPPSIPSDLKPAQITTLSEHSPQNENAAPPSTVPSAAPQLAEPQRVTPSMSSRCEHCVSSHKRLIPTTPLTAQQRIATSFTVWIAPTNTSKVSSLLSELTWMWRDGDAVKRWFAPTEALMVWQESLAFLVSPSTILAFPTVLAQC